MSTCASCGTVFDNSTQCPQCGSGGRSVRVVSVPSQSQRTPSSVRQGWLLRAAALMVVVVMLIGELCYPPWLVYQELTLQVGSSPTPSDASITGRSVVAKLGHSTRGAFGTSPVIHNARPRGWTDRVAFDAPLVIDIDWERLTIESLFAVAVAASLWWLGGVYRRAGRQ